MTYFLRLLFLFTLFLNFLGAEPVMSLKDNLMRARVGDYIVAYLNKNYILLHIFSKELPFLTIEEITIPASRINASTSWKKWMTEGAPGHTNWILYRVNANSGEMKESYSISQQAWLNLSQGNHFLPTLLNIHLTYLPKEERKRIGSASEIGPDRRAIWQPKMVVEGQVVKDVSFSAWRTRWPNDNSQLSGKMIDVYVPEENEKYPSYFPYWLQIRGTAGSKATIHIIDSGSHLISPIKEFPKR